MHLVHHRIPQLQSAVQNVRDRLSARALTRFSAVQGHFRRTAHRLHIFNTLVQHPHLNYTSTPLFPLQNAIVIPLRLRCPPVIHTQPCIGPHAERDATHDPHRRRMLHHYHRHPLVCPLLHALRCVDSPPPRVGVCRHVPYLNLISKSSKPLSRT